MCVSIYVSVCQSMCKRRDRGGRERMISRQGGESVNKAQKDKAGSLLQNLVHRGEGGWSGGKRGKGGQLHGDRWKLDFWL